jgi:hypothetical protein
MIQTEAQCQSDSDTSADAYSAEAIATLRTLRRVAPRAMRMPNSLVRCATE